MELLTYLKLTLTTDMHSSTCSNTFQCDLQALCQNTARQRYHRNHTFEGGGEVLLYKKSATNKPRSLEKESLIQIGAAYILAESLKVRPKT